jgi:hypothetical protein
VLFCTVLPKIASMTGEQTNGRVPVALDDALNFIHSS